MKLVISLSFICFSSLNKFQTKLMLSYISASLTNPLLWLKIKYNYVSFIQNQALFVLIFVLYFLIKKFTYLVRYNTIFVCVNKHFFNRRKNLRASNQCITWVSLEIYLNKLIDNTQLKLLDNLLFFNLLVLSDFSTPL